MTFGKLRPQIALAIICATGFGLGAIYIGFLSEAT